MGVLLLPWTPSGVCMTTSGDMARGRRKGAVEGMYGQNGGHMRE